MDRTLLPAKPLLLLTIAVACQTAIGQTVSRGPYLQQGTPTSIIVKWRTSAATDSEVRYGSSPLSLTSSVSNPASTTEHELLVSGLSANTKYFYSIGTSTQTLAGGDDDHYFITSPPTGTAKPTRAWVLGDSGTADANARAVRDAYLSFLDADQTDLLLMLGDNAYNDGTDSEYQGAVFDMYPQFLRNTVVWPTLGNHDGHTADSQTLTGPYYDIFKLPMVAEAGGVASGTEAYYSFDYGNVHFICLDSYDTDRSPGGAMMTWLQSDLQANTLPWVIAFWHHPPYSKGSHNSDTEGRLIDMRTAALPILEQHGVDLVLGGHSHAYERSFLIDGHYGGSSTFAESMKKDAGSGQEENDGAYQKPDLVAAANAGTVYTVAGSSGKVSGGTLDHPAMFFSVNVLGSVVLDISDDRLDATFLDSTGNIQDYYTLHKGPDTKAPQLTSAESPDSATVEVVFSEPVEQAGAENSSNYAIDQGITVTAAALNTDRRMVTLTTSALTPAVTYTLTVNNVADNSGNTIAPNSQQQFQSSSTVEDSFQDGVSPDSSYSGTTDTYLSENSPPSNFGSSTVLLADGDDPGGSGFDKATVIRWDISSIPSGSTVQSAEITFNVFNPTSGVYELYEVKRSWDEAVASWTVASTGDNWEVAGAQGSTDRGSTVLGELSVGAASSHTLVLNASGVAVVQAWVDNPSTNLGVIIANSTTGDGVDFDSREVATPSNRPKLTVFYEPSGGDPPPDPPTGLTETSKTDTEVSLSWTAPSGGGPVTDYNVYRDSVLIDNTTNTTYTDTGLNSNTSYDYFVTAVGPGGESGESNTISVTTDPPPPATTVRVDSISQQLQSNKKFRFARSTVTVLDDNGDPVSGADVTGRSTIPERPDLDPVVETLSTNSAGQASFDSAQVHKSESVQFQFGVTDVVKSGFTYDEAGSVTGTCITSDGTSCGPPDTNPPAAPTNLTATPAPLSVGLDWDDNSEPDLAGYEVFRSTVSGDFSAPPIASVGTSDYNDTNVVDGVEYFYIVKAFDASGNRSGQSNEASAIPAPPSGDTMHIDAIGVQVIKRGQKYLGRATITIVSSGAGNPAVASAVVSGDWTMPDGSTVSGNGTTNSSGVAVIDSPKVNAATGQQFTFTVTGVQHGSFPYNPGDNVADSASGTVP